MSEKDFLSQLAEENKKPDSFKEEERVPINKEKKPIKPWMIVAPIILVLLVFIGVYFLFLRAKIEMPNFVGKTKDDVAKWVTQYQINPSGIIFDESFSMEYDKNVVMSQTVEAGSKVKEDVKINFGLSKGPDPDESISVPDLKSMVKEEIDDWIKENKLLSTKTITAFSNSVPEGEVIDVDYKGCKEDSFTRGCSLNITISKGVAPAGTITVEDFTNKDVSSAETWADKNKIELVISERFDDKVGANLVISQSVEPNKTMKQGETLTIVVSKGEGVKVPDFSKMTKNEVKEWLEENSSVSKVKQIYSNEKTFVLEQNVKAGEMVGPDDKLEISINMGNTFYISDIEGAPTSIVGTSYNKIVDWCNSLREYGIDAAVGKWTERDEVYSSEYPAGTIVSVKCLSHSTDEEYDCNGRLPLDVRFDIVKSKGQNTRLSIPKCSTVSELVDFLAKNNIQFTLAKDIDYERVGLLYELIENDPEEKKETGEKYTRKPVNLGEDNYLYSDRKYEVDSGRRVTTCLEEIEPEQQDDKNQQ